MHQAIKTFLIVLMQRAQICFILICWLVLVRGRGHGFKIADEFRFADRVLFNRPGCDQEQLFESMHGQSARR